MKFRSAFQNIWLFILFIPIALPGLFGLLGIAWRFLIMLSGI